MNDDANVIGLPAAGRVAGLTRAALRRRMAAGAITSRRDNRGRHRFLRSDLIALRADETVGSFAIGSTDAGETAAAESGITADNEKGTSLVADGDVAAEVFAAIQAGQMPAEVVVQLRLRPAVVSRLYEQFLTMEGATVVAAGDWARLRALAGVETTVELVSIAERLVVAETALGSLRYPCSGCGQPAHLDATLDWPALLDAGALDDFGHAQCVAK